MRGIYLIHLTIDILRLQRRPGGAEVGAATGNGPVEDMASIGMVLTGSLRLVFSKLVMTVLRCCASL